MGLDTNSLNKVILIGHLGQDPELRYLPQTERAVARFSLATNERFYNKKTNENDSRVEWHRIVAWGKTAEFCEKFLNKGKQICLEGKIRSRSWQDKEGNKRYTTEIETNTIVLIGKRDDTVQDQSFSKSDFPDADTYQSENKSEIEDQQDDDDEVPF
ncbi:MAG: single-stranded DNA-binding protein [Candidatus Aminicenantaceae bacterium]